MFLWLTVPCESASLRSLSCLLTCTFEITFLKHNLHPKVLTEHACQVMLDNWADNVDFIHIFHTNCRLILILSFNQQHRHRLGLDTALTLIGSVTITCRKLFLPRGQDKYTRKITFRWRMHTSHFCFYHHWNVREYKTYYILLHHIYLYREACLPEGFS